MPAPRLHRFARLALGMLVAGCAPDLTPVGFDGALCSGVRPPDAAWSASPAPKRAGDAGVPEKPDGGGCVGAACPGAPTPPWALLDFQPRSCGFGATYGVEMLRGRVVFLALWVGS